ncbi:MAG: hypothetical protein M0R70_01690 [Nitrospirae bacterium]|nr:hypothetical protein [Nitrospirota bacterium]
MLQNHMDAVIGAIASLAGVVIGFFLQLFSNHLSNQKKIKDEFAATKNAIDATTIFNNLFPVLHDLKHFFVRNPKFLKRGSNMAFFNKWLMEPLVEESFTGIGYWTQDKVNEMLNDLAKTETA